MPLRDERIVDPRAAYDHAKELSLRGNLEESQQEAERGYQRFRTYDDRWASRLRLVEAESMVLRGKYQDALRILAILSPALKDPDETVERLTFEGLAFAHLQQFSEAAARLGAAESICAANPLTVCGGVPRARGVLAVERGEFSEAQSFFLKSLDFARLHHDRWLEASALLNLGTASLQLEHYDEALDWSKLAHQASIDLGGEDLQERSLGNVGWAYFGLGDMEKSLECFVEAEKSAARLGNPLFQVKWLTTAGDVYWNLKDIGRATQSYRKALDLAAQIDSREDSVDLLEDLAHASIDAGQLGDANGYLQRLAPLLRANASRLDALDMTLAQGRLAAALRQDRLAEEIFRKVEADPASQSSMRIGAEHELARLSEVQGDAIDADRMYRTTLSTFESTRAQLKHEDSKLPFLANATGIYDDYIHFLVSHGKTAQALEIADQSRARTLAQGLGLAPNTRAFDRTALQPGNVAQKAGATLLFYWLGQKQSYLWAITPTKTALFPLPAQSELMPKIERYREALLGPNNAVDLGNADGNALYQILIAPARKMIPPDSTVAILSDGVLSQLNFETLIVPGTNPHYWIEDATLISAPSLSMLASARPSQNPGGKMLLIGDAVSPSADYPELPMAAFEVRQIRKHFAEQETTVIARQQASPDAYMSSAPQQYSYIHFVAHGVSSRTDPLDSAIILSRTSSAEDSFKLYAREIIQRPIHARLVTISACYGSGTRSYAGEGLVGLSWAFLRAGAHNVIGALWEVSDESTPRLMDSLYEGVESGLPPSAALRQAKLALLHSQSSFSKPFFWAPFQIYTGL
ncbi:MAG: CHAT domain-containing protein [Terracidiphilus sp.]